MIDTTIINTVAAAQALSFVIGDEARMAVENLYTVIDGAMLNAHQKGFIEGQELAEQDDTVYVEGFNDGFTAGVRAATSTERPSAVILPAHEGDRGDEDEGFELTDAELALTPLCEAVTDLLVHYDYDGYHGYAGVQRLAVDFTRRWARGFDKA